MICNIHSHGTSFKGLARYVTHDKGADTSERVAWSHTHNVATTDPDLAARIMAATAMDNEALKEAAGIKSTGRKMQKSVMHYSLSWKDEERGDLSRDEMVQAALASLASLGADEGEYLGRDKKAGKKKYALRTQRGDEHQAVIVCHDEGPGSQPHVHIMVNRIHPECGTVLSDTNNFNKLSDWALEYRKAQGKEDYCPERVINAAIRAQGYRTHNKRVPRNVYEQDKAAEDFKKSPRHAAILDAQRRKAAELKAKQDELKQRQREEFRAKEKGILDAEKVARDALAEKIRTARNEKRNAFRLKAEEIAERHLAEKVAFDEAQQTFKGKVQASFDALKSKEWMREIRTHPLHAMTDAFKMAFSSGLQKQQLEKSQDQQARELQAKLKQEQAETAAQLRDDLRKKNAERVGYFETERADLFLQQKMAKAKIAAEWKQLRDERKAALAVPLPSPERPKSQIEIKPPPLPPNPPVEAQEHPQAVEPPAQTIESPERTQEPLRPTFEEVAAPAPLPTEQSDEDARKAAYEERMRAKFERNSLQSRFNRDDGSQSRERD